MKDIKNAKCSIRATFDDKTITVYQAYSSSIANLAEKSNSFVKPFQFDRMTWIKPSLLWMIYRSDWACRAGQENILQIRIKRSAWDSALNEAILTTPEKRVYPDQKKWRRLLEKARVRIQWDPERDIHNRRLEIKSIQVGITKHLTEEFSKEWIVDITNITPKVKMMQQLVEQKKVSEAERLLPLEREYPLAKSIKEKIGMV